MGSVEIGYMLDNIKKGFNMGYILLSENGIHASQFKTFTMGCTLDSEKASRRTNYTQRTTKRGRAGSNKATHKDIEHDTQHKKKFKKNKSNNSDAG